MSKYQAYPEYKNSGTTWLGDLPCHWQVLPTKRFFKLVAEPAPQNNNYELLSVYTEIGVNPRKELEQKGNKASTTDGYWQVKKGDIILNKLLAWMGAVGYSAYNGVTSPAYDILRPTSDFNARFYHYLFRSEPAKQEFKRWSRGIMEMRLRLYFDELGRILMPFPPKDEIEKITAFLDHETAKIDTLIDKQQQLIKLLKEKRQAVISHAVTKGLNPDAPMKDSGVEWLGEVPAHWNISRLGFHTTKIGSGKTPKGGAEIYQDSGVLFLRSQNVYDDGLRIAKSESVYINESIHHEMAGSSVQDGDVLLNITGGSIGRSCLVPSNFPDANVNQHVCILRFPTSIHEFFSFVMKSNSIKEQINAFQTGGNREGLNFEQISKLKFTLPPLDEINFIIDHIKSITFTFNTLEEQAQQAINLIRERRTALISAAVTGKIDVRYPVSRPTGNAENEHLEPTI